MKFAFIIMGDFDMTRDMAQIHDGMAQIIGVSSLAEAKVAAEKLFKEGVGCIELCGAFGEAGAKAIIEVTDNQIPIGYITHLPEQDEVYAKAFGK